jgi:nicotinamide riboside kinase
MIKIGMVGLPSTGKTTLSQTLSSSFLGKKVELIKEYARDYINKYGEIKEIWEQIRIANKQLAWENKVPNTVDLLITDGPIFTGWAYASTMRKFNSSKEYMLINDLFKILNKHNNPLRYDIVFYLAEKFKPQSDGTRIDLHLNDNWREKMNYYLINTYELFPPKHFIVVDAEDPIERVEFCREKIKELTNI